MTNFLAPGLGSIGGTGTPSTDTTALRSINSQNQTFVNKDFVKNIAWLNNSVDTLSGWSQKLQSGVDQANQNAIEQIQGIWSDMFVLVAGLSPTGINIGDIKYVLQGIGALFGVNPGTPFPMNLFDAAFHMFSTYIVPTTQFTDVIFQAVDAWAPVFGLSPQFMTAVHNLENAVNGLTSSLTDLLGAAQKLIDAFGPDLSPLLSMFDSFTNLFNAVDLSALQPVISALANLGIPFINALTALVNAGNSFLTPFGLISGSQIGTLGSNIAPKVIKDTTLWSIGSNNTTAWMFDPANSATGADGSFTTLGNGTSKTVKTQQIYPANPGGQLAFGAKINWVGIPTGTTGFGIELIWCDLGVETGVVTPLTIPSGHSATSGPWTALGPQTITIPANVDGFKIGAYVDNTITTGQVWVDDITVQLSGTVSQNAVTGLVAALGSLIPINWFDSLIGGATTQTNLLTYFQNLIPLSFFNGLIGQTATTGNLTTWFADLGNIVNAFVGGFSGSTQNSGWNTDTLFNVAQEIGTTLTNIGTAQTNVQTMVQNGFQIFSQIVQQLSVMPQYNLFSEAFNALTFWTFGWYQSHYTTTQNTATNTSDIAAIKAHLNSGTSSIVYDFFAAVALTANYVDVSNVSHSQAWTTLNGYGGLTPHDNYVCGDIDFITRAEWFTGNPTGATADKGVITNKFHVEVTIEYASNAGVSGVFCGGHVVSGTLGQHVSLEINLQAYGSSIAIATNTAISTGRVERLKVSTNNGINTLQTGDVIAIECDGAGNYRMYVNGTLVQPDAGPDHWNDSGGVITTGPGYHASGIIEWNNGPRLGHYVAYDITT